METARYLYQSTGPCAPGLLTHPTLLLSPELQPGKVLKWPRILAVTLDYGEELHLQRPSLKPYCVAVNRCAVSLNPTFLYVK